jgi:hypothetical protein
MVDAVNNETISYLYDEQDRLLNAGAPVNESYTHSRIGNFLTKNTVSYSYDPSHAHAVNG